MARTAIIPEALAKAVAETGFSPAIRAGDMVFLTGATGADANGEMPDDIAKQILNALEKVDMILTKCDADRDSIVEMTTYFTDIDTDFDVADTTLRQHLGEPLPAWTALQAGKLRRTGARIELRLTVHAPVMPTTPGPQ